MDPSPPPPRAPRQEPWKRLLVVLLATLASMVLHVELYRRAGPLLAGWSDPLGDVPVRVRFVEESEATLTPDQIARLDALPAVEEPEPEPEEEPEPEPPKPRGQIVETPPPDEQKIPLESDYLAEYDNAVAKESRTERFKVNPEVLANRFSDEAKYQMEDAIDVGASKASTGATVGGQTESAPGKGAPRSLLPSEWTVTNKAGVAAPVPSSSRTQALAGAPQNDLLDEARSDVLALNTRQFYGAAYLNRIRRQVNLYWQQNVDNLPSSVRLSKPRYVTVLDVVLNADGMLESAVVTAGSGSEPVDLCVVNAFRVAGPFKNPPEQLISKDGRVYLPEFDFTLEVGHAQLPYQGIDPRAGVQFPGIMRAPR